MFKFPTAAMVCICSLGTITSASAATITWGDATNTTTTADISAAGNLVKAFNSGGAAITLNGVTFSQFASTGDDVWDSFNALFPGQVGTNSVFDDLADLGALDPLLRTANFLAPVGGGSHVITLSGLNTGSEYEIQIFFTDQRGSITSPPGGCLGCNDREVTFTSGASAVTLEADPGNAPTSPFGQFTIGRFTADASTQEFTISGPEVQQVNAWQLRAPIPEPATVWLFGAGLGVLAVMRRSRPV